VSTHHHPLTGETATGLIMVAFRWSFTETDPPELVARGTLYTYSTTTPVAVGDTVVVPGNYLNPDPQAAIVAVLGSTYARSVDPILRVTNKRGQRVAS
jgi:hypothetical protein